MKKVAAASMLLTFSTFSNGAQAMVGIEDGLAWQTPNWGFTRPSLRKSLIFDQSFDSQSFRPAPAPAKVVEIKTPERSAVASVVTPVSPKVEIVLAQKIPEKIEDKSIVKLSPSTEHKELASRPSFTKFKLPRANAKLAKVVVLDDESFNQGKLEPLQEATIHWVGLQSGISQKFVNGVVASPYPNTTSMRFVIEAPGYISAVGYAIGGIVNPQLMIRESKIPAIIKSLGIAPQANYTIALGKVLSKGFKAQSSVSIDASIAPPFKVFYSLGNFGLFHPAAQKTGPSGDFVVTGLSSGVQYLMPTTISDENSFDWPAHTMDFSNLPSVVSLTLVESEAKNLHTQVFDAFSLERPPVGIQATIGGQRGVFIPDDEGLLKLPAMQVRASTDLVEVRAEGYRTTWVNTIANQKILPDTIGLFTNGQVDEIFAPVIDSINNSKGIIFGNLRPELFKKATQVKIFDSNGRKAPQAQVVYFDQDNVAQKAQKSTDSVVQNFAVYNLEPGEWHLLLIDPRTGQGVGAQTVRTDYDVVSQIQF